MSELATFARLGIHHILDPAAVDHLLFLLVLAAAYRLSEWREAVGVITAFTAGHSATLALAATDTLLLPAQAVEFLIPLTIIATGLENLAGAGGRVGFGPAYRPTLAAVFGLVHGAGFAYYLRGLFLESITVPLLGFNLGIELAQVIVLGAAGIGLAVVDWLASHRVRVVAVSSVVLVLAARMAVTRSPWQP